MHDLSTPADRCPLCRQVNVCAMEAQRRTGRPQPPCWCAKVAFSTERLASVPDAAKGRACLCRACAVAAGPKGPE